MNAHQTDSLSLGALISYAVILVMIWGSAFTMITVGVQYLPPLWLVTYRLLIGAVLVILYLIYKGLRLPSWRDPRWRWYFALGMSGSMVPFSLTAAGQRTVDSGLSAIIIGAMPLMTIILAHVFTPEKLNRRKLIGFIIGFIGTIILFLPDDLSLNLVKDWPAQTMILGAGFCYAVTTVGAKRAPATPSTVAAAMMLICAASACLIAAVLSGIPDPLFPPTGLVMATGLAIGSTAIATILYLYVIEKTGPSMMARINLFTPIVSVVLGIWILSEPFGWRMAFAILTIGIGVIISRSESKPV